jgi:hypothetical protein
MENIVSFCKKNIWKISTFVFFILFLSKGCINNRISNLEKKYKKTSILLEQKVDSLQVLSRKTATALEIRNQMEVVMFNYLIYEDDLDKGKISLSDIKNKIEEND